MQLITLDQFIENQQFFIQEAKAGKTFIYPTDTVYGIGWIYTPEMVNKIFAIKQRDRLDHQKNEWNKVFLDVRAIPTIWETVSTNEVKWSQSSKTVVCTKKMFSIIAPNFDRIAKEYPEANIEALKMYLNNYHGVTYIFDYNQPGIRIIKHPFQTFVENLGEAFITTSCNLAGEPTVTETQNIPAELSDRIDYIINAWPLDGKPSVLIDLVENKIIER